MPRPLNRVLMTGWLATSMFTTGCLFEKKPRAFRPLPVAAKVPVPVPPPEFPPPPELAAELTPIEEPPGPHPLQATAPTQPRAARPTNTAKPVAVQLPPETPAVDPPPVPQLGQIFTPAQIQQNTQLLETYLDRVRRAMQTFATKTLNKDDRETAAQVGNFLMQAVQAKDLAAAVSLAKRADSLAADLLSRLP